MDKLIRRVDADTISKYLGKECFNDLGQKCVVVGYCKAYRLFILAVLDKDANGVWNMTPYHDEKEILDEDDVILVHSPMYTQYRYSDCIFIE